jgi:hypothetical protein
MHRCSRLKISILAALMAFGSAFPVTAAADGCTITCVKCSCLFSGTCECIKCTIQCGRT